MSFNCKNKVNVLSDETMNKIEDGMYDDEGWKNIGNGLKMDKYGFVIGGLKVT